MKRETIQVKLEFTEPLLGSASANRNIHEEFIARRFTEDKEKREKVALAADTAAEMKAHIAEEIASIPEPDPDMDEVQEKAKTIFPRDDHGLHLWDYQVRGFFKECVEQLIELGADSVKGLTKWSYKKAVDRYLFVNPRKIYLFDLTGDRMWKEAPDEMQRPLRAETLRGERVALATSECLPPGTTCQFEVLCIRPVGQVKKTTAVFTADTIKECLEFGQYKGMGQWRGSGGFGRFTFEIAED